MYKYVLAQNDRSPEAVQILISQLQKEPLIKGVHSLLFHKPILDTLMYFETTRCSLKTIFE